MPVRKHKAINQQTGKLKKGYKYSGKTLKSGLPQIVKIQKKVQKKVKRKVVKKAQNGGNFRFGNKRSIPLVNSNL